jgi:RNA polymerase sigma-70 factor, ECF subfamily
MNDQTAKLPATVLAAQAGPHVTLAELHATYSRRLHKTIVAITKNLEDAEDALQETFLRAHVALHTFEGRSSIYSWLTRIAINSALMVLRRRRSHPETLFDFQSGAGDETNHIVVEDSAPNPEEICDRRQRRLKVLSAISSFHPGLREPIRMQMTRGASIREISRALDISETTVKARLYRARRRLSAHFVSDHHGQRSAVEKQAYFPNDRKSS